MAATYTPITLDEVRGVLKAEKGWEESDKIGNNEYVFDWHLKSNPAVIVRVYTSVSKHGGKGRGCGKDAIRVCAIKGDRGLVKSRRVHRTQGWRENLQKRVMSVLEIAKERATWR